MFRLEWSRGCVPIYIDTQLEDGLVMLQVLKRLSQERERRVTERLRRVRSSLSSREGIYSGLGIHMEGVK
jgi:hypothetical protein